MNQSAVLRTVGITDEMGNLFGQVRRVNGEFLGRFNARIFGTFKEITHQRMHRDAVAYRPGLGINIAVHQQLAEAQQGKRDVPPDGPSFLEPQNGRELGKVAVGGVVIVEQRDFNAEVTPHLLNQRQVRFDVFSEY
jgi:hypothetical protein